MSDSDKTSVTVFLKPPCFDVEMATLDVSAQLKWEHWLIRFENFIASIRKKSSNSSLSESDWEEYKFRLLINHLSTRVYSYIKNYTNYNSAMKKLRELAKEAPTAATTIAIKAAKSDFNSADYLLNCFSYTDAYSKYSLRFTITLFRDAKLGIKIETPITRLQKNQIKEVFETRDEYHRTLIQVAILHRHIDLAGDLLRIKNTLYDDEHTLHEVYGSRLIKISDAFIKSSLHNLYNIRNTKDFCHIFGLNLLHAACSYFENYGKCICDAIVVRDVATLANFLEAMEYDFTCQKLEKPDQGRGLLYYDLLFSEKQSDIEKFADLFERNATAAVKRFVSRLKNEKLINVLSR